MVLVAPIICTSSVAISTLLTVLDEELEGISVSEATLVAVAEQEIVHFFDEIFCDGIPAAAETLLLIRDKPLTVLEDGEESFEGDAVERTGEHDTNDESEFFSDDKIMFFFDDATNGFLNETLVSNGRSTVFVSAAEDNEEGNSVMGTAGNDELHFSDDESMFRVVVFVTFSSTFDTN